MPFAVLQFLGGGNLRQKIEASGGRQSLDDVRSWLVPIADVLDFIHSKYCLHRDVKPANIIFDDGGHSFLADFGISTALDQFDAEAPTADFKDPLTVVGGFIGSPAYVPPEAIDRRFTPQFDQYSLATVVYVALAGALPFEGTTPTMILHAKATKAPRPLERADLKGPISGASRRALMKALSTEPSQRFASCGEFAAALLGEDSSQASRRRLIALAGVIVTSLLFVAGYTLWDRYAGESLPSEDPALEGSVSQQSFTPSAPEASVQLGSTVEQRKAAVALCLKYGGSCTIDQFADEIERFYELAPIDIDPHEVTNREFGAWVESEKLEAQAERRGSSRDGLMRVSGLSWREPLRDRNAGQHPRDPVVHVSFSEAADYCASKGRRLPTHDEWEFAARGPERRIFPWGSAWATRRVRAIDAGGVGLEPVGSHPTGDTPDEISDLAGSVWEWTTDVRNDQRIRKGGSWDLAQPAYLRASMIGLVPLDETSSDIGFRCVVSLK